jgi:hypothetical protein
MRIRAQLNDFALATHALSQPLGNSYTYLDPTFPTPKDASGPVEFNLRSAQSVRKPTHSPYGDNWEVLWLGHCGARFPNADRDPKCSRGRVVLYDDPTVPQTQHYKSGYGSKELIEQHPNHTRVIHHTAENVCILAYAVTQASARRILYQLALKEFDAPYDIMLRRYCDGADNRKVRNCFTAQPQYFEHFRPRGETGHYSDINNYEPGTNEKDYSYNIRISTKVNLGKLSEGEVDFIDQYPDA